MVYIINGNCSCCDRDTKVTYINDYPFRRFLCDFCINGGGCDSSLLWGIMHYINGNFVRGGTSYSLKEVKKNKLLQLVSDKKKILRFAFDKLKISQMPNR